MAFYENKIFSSAVGKGVMVSTDTGKTWSARNNGLPIPKHEIMSLKIYNNMLFAGSDTSFYISTDFGESWQERRGNLPDTNLLIWQIEANENNIYIVTQVGIYLSTDLGNTWSNISGDLPKWEYYHKDYYHCKIMLYQNNIFAVINATNDGVFLSTDNGKNWIAKNEGIETFNIENKCMSSILIIDDYAFVGNMQMGYFGRTNCNAIYIVKLDYALADVAENNNRNNNFSIFPNPAKDEININLGEALQILSKIEIFDVCGQKVTENEIPVGATTYQINIQNLSTGIYYCIINSGINKVSKSFLVVK
jgi:hypothetical protein